MAWPLLNSHGILIFDDYEWAMMPRELENPKLGVNAFLFGCGGQYRELHRGYRIIVEKQSDRAELLSAIAARQRRIDTLQEAVMAERRRLHLSEAKLAKHRRKLENIRASLSWRLTAPLRLIAPALRSAR